jgi:hypothetical protein
MDSYLVEMEQDIQNYNVVKELVINKLVDEGLMSQEDGEDFIDRCQIIVVKNGWFKRWCSKFSKGNESMYTVRILEMYKNKLVAIDKTK